MVIFLINDYIITSGYLKNCIFNFRDYGQVDFDLYGQVEKRYLFLVNQLCGKQGNFNYHIRAFRGKNNLISISHYDFNRISTPHHYRPAEI